MILKKPLILSLILMLVVLMPAVSSFEYCVQPGEDIEVVVSGNYTDHLPYKAFDGSESTFWWAPTTYGYYKWLNPDGFFINKLKIYQNQEITEDLWGSSPEWGNSSYPLINATLTNKGVHVEKCSDQGRNTTGWIKLNYGGKWGAIAEVEFCFDTACGYVPPSFLPIVEFEGIPLDGYAPLDVNFTISNYTLINTSAVNRWNFGDGSVVDVNGSSITHTYDRPGIYTVSLAYTNISDYESSVVKSDYVLVSNASGLAVNLDIKNAITGALVQDSTVGIQNTTTGVWRNTTAPTGLVYFTSTDPGYLYPLTQGQSITLAANKSGYQDASTTFNIPYNNYRAILYMMPTSVINSTGNGTVVVNVIRALNGLTVSGMSVALDSGQVGITNTAGAVTLFNVTAGERTASVTDPDGAYLPTEKTFNLTAGETKLVTVYVARDDDPPIEDPDDPFQEPTPTPTRTYDPNDPSSPVYGNYTTSEINQQGGAGVLGMLAQLIGLWPAIVVFAFLKFMRSAMT